MAGQKRDDKQISVGNVSRVSGKVTIAGGDIYEGYTAEQVSILLEQITTKYQRKTFDGRCPYKGLEVFEEEDADLFFGRERLVQDLLSRVKESRTVFITGPSGSGKSSLVRAGLIHALKNGAIRNSRNWLYEIMKPGREPLKELALAFSRLKSPGLADYFTAHMEEGDILHRCAESVLSGRKDQRFVLFVDQFEEVFTQVNEESERRAFLEMLAPAGTIKDGRVIVLFAMRSDFLSNCAAYPAINELISQQFRQVGAMQPEELVSAIALPAKEVGLPIEEELVAQIISDMKGEPGALPLMQFALQELFEARQAKGKDIALTLEDYLERGGLKQMLARHADETFNKLGNDQQELARSIFSGLIEIGKGRQDTRRTALFNELIPANTNAVDVEAVVHKLADARLIITDEQAGKDTVTISHERLITAWPWLEKLINENRDVIALQNDIADDAKEWSDHEEDSSYLYAGVRLANAHEQFDAKKLVLNDLAKKFLDESLRVEQNARALEEARRHRELNDALKLAAAESQRADTEKQRAEEQIQSASKLRRRALYLTIALLSALVAVGGAVFFSRTAKEQTEQALAIKRFAELQAIASSHLDDQPDLSALLGIEAARYYQNHRINQNNIDLNAEERILQAQSGTQLIAIYKNPNGAVTSLAFNPINDSLLASGGCGKPQANSSGCNQGEILLWNTSNSSLSKPRMHLYGHQDIVNTVAFSPDGKILVSGGQDGTMIFWNVSDPDTPAKYGESIDTGEQAVQAIAFSPNGRILVSGSEDGAIIVWDTSNPAMPNQISKIPGESSNAVLSIAFNPKDGNIIAAGDQDGTIRIWNISDPAHPRRVNEIKNECTESSYLKIQNSIYSLSFTVDGKWLAYGRKNGAVQFLDPFGAPPYPPPSCSIPMNDTLYFSSLGGGVRSLAIRSDGKALAVGTTYEIIEHWDLSQFDAHLFDSLDILPSDQETILVGHDGDVLAVAYNRSGNLLASGSDDGTLRLWQPDLKVKGLLLSYFDNNSYASDQEKLIEEACQEAGRNFSRLEWIQYFPGEEYRVTCPQWPPEIEVYMPKRKTASSKQTNIQVGNISDISGNVNVAGGHITTHHTVIGLSASEIKQLFDGLYAEIDRRANTSPANKEDIKAEVKEIQSTVTQAAQKNEKVDEGFLSRRFRNIARMAPDVLDVVVATLGNPLAGLGVAVKKIAEKAKQETSTS